MCVCVCLLLYKNFPWVGFSKYTVDCLKITVTMHIKFIAVLKMFAFRITCLLSSTVSSEITDKLTAGGHNLFI